MSNTVFTRIAVVLALAVGLAPACTERGHGEKEMAAMSQHDEKVTRPGEAEAGQSPLPKNDAEWRERLTPEQFRVTRQKGTEAPFTGAYWDTDTPGVYRCVCCDVVLFKSNHKFDAGCGWPSFWESATENVIKEERDVSHGMVRTEVMCRNCDAHLGHVFDDGPQPTGQRYCINSASIKLEKRDDAEKQSGPPKPGTGK